MGNIVNCCLKVSDFFHHKDPGDRIEEQSSLLSRGNSDVESSSPSRISGDHQASVLDEDHLLFPDIVLSSNLRVDLVRGDPALLPTKDLAENARNVDEKLESDQQKGERKEDLVGQPSTITLQNNLPRLDKSQSLSTDEWPLLSSVYLRPLDRLTAVKDQICTRGLQAKTFLGVKDKETTDPCHGNMIHGGQKHKLREAKQKRRTTVDPKRTAQTNFDGKNSVEIGFPVPLKKGKQAQNIDSVAQEVDSNFQDVMENSKQSASTESLEMNVFKKVDLWEPFAVDMMDVWPENSQTLIQMDHNVTWETKMAKVQWDLEALKQKTGLLFQDSAETTFMVCQIEQKTDLTDCVTLLVVDKLLFMTPSCKGPGLERMACEHFLLDAQADSPTEQAETQGLPAVPDIDPSEDPGFTVKIQAPGTEPTDFQVSPLAMVQEIKQVLMDREETCRCTCFSLQLEGVTLDNYAHLKSIPGLQDGSVLIVIEEPYTIREVRLHLRHIRDLLKSLDFTDGYNGVDGGSLSFLSSVTDECVDEISRPIKRVDGLKHPNCSPPDFIFPGCKERRLVPLQPQANVGKHTSECLKVLTVSSWNPPPGNRKMHGDLVYLTVVTMEDQHFSVTASTRGFYINQSTSYSFNPKPENPNIFSHSLLDLLCHVSPIFTKNFNSLLKRRELTHPFERIATPYQVFSWTAPELDHAMDCVRAEDSSSSCLTYDEHEPVQARDWNEELQSTRELPRTSATDRLMRDRAVFKANSDFVSTATQGALAVIDGNVTPVNPCEDHHQQMFLWNNILFSLGFDVRDQFRDVGGEAAAHAALLQDFNGVKAHWAVDQEELHLLGTVLIDYRGHRVAAQTIVPGILENDQEKCVVYGSVDFGQTVVSNARYVKLLEKSSKMLKVQRHKVLDKDDRVVELCSSVEQKGIVGNDGRHYILDLLYAFPPDLNFLPMDSVHNPECQKHGFPREHPHRLVSLRFELIEAFTEHRYQLLMKTISGSLQSETDITSAPVNITKLKTEQPVSMQVSSGRHVLSSFRNTFDLRFNPNIFSAGVRFPKASTEEIQKQKRQLKDAAEFLVIHQIPAFMRSCLNHTSVPMDGATLTEALHQHGISIRYLGSVLESIEKMQQQNKLGHVYIIAFCELITRCAKHIFKSYLLSVEPSSFSSSISHFLNCFLGSVADAEAIQQNDRLLSRCWSLKGRGLGNVDDTITGWPHLSPSNLWVALKAEAQVYYHYSLPCGSIMEATGTCRLQKITMLREFAIKTGIQILLREYDFDSGHQPFTEEDILNIFPIVKHITPRSSDALCLLHYGQTKVQQGCLMEGSELINQALGLFTNVYGALHQDVCECLRLLGTIHYLHRDYAEALSHQQRAVLISERVLGIDHPNTVQEYKQLGLFCFVAGQSSVALRLLYRARFLMLLVCGDDHPEMASLDSVIGLMLHSMMTCDQALKFLENALALTSKYHGPSSLKLAQCHHLLAKVHESKGDFTAALIHEKARHCIYMKQIGEAHEKTRESSEYLKLLTHQGVILQKTMKWIYKTGSDTNISPFNLKSPSRDWTVEQLNLVMGIVFIKISEVELVEFQRTV